MLGLDVGNWLCILATMDYIRLKTSADTCHFVLDPTTRMDRYRVYRCGDVSLVYDMDYDRYGASRAGSSGRTTWFHSPQWALDSFLLECAGA